tara:strand:- start:38948 stop:39136 length:189 start_codon:yes stop_codon:yes gene_type:complete
MGFKRPTPCGPSKTPKVRRKTTLGIENLAAISWAITPATITMEKIVIKFDSIMAEVEGLCIK